MRRRLNVEAAGESDVVAYVRCHQLAEDLVGVALGLDVALREEYGQRFNPDLLAICDQHIQRRRATREQDLEGGRPAAGARQGCELELESQVRDLLWAWIALERLLHFRGAVLGQCSQLERQFHELCERHGMPAREKQFGWKRPLIVLLPRKPRPLVAEVVLEGA